MRKESDIPVIFSDREEGVLKKGTRINSIFEKLKTLSGNNGADDRFEAETDDEQHISLPAEGSEEPEVHSVTIYDADGNEAIHIDASTEEQNGFEPDSADPPEAEFSGRGYAAEIYEVQPVEGFEAPPFAPGFVSEESEVPLEYPDPDLSDYSYSLNGDEYTREEIPNEMNGGFDKMHEEDDSNVVAEKEGWESQEFKEESRYQYAENEAAAAAAGSAGNPADTEAPSLNLTSSELESISSPLEFVELLQGQGVKADKFVKKLKYEETLKGLQHECSKLQQSVKRNNERVIVIFEGMELSGKYDTIRKITKYMDPRSVRIVSLAGRTQDERQEWYFERYTKHLPRNGEIVFFNRSWYDRGVLEPIHGLCDDEEYGRFLTQAPEFEYMLIENGYKVIKIWLSVTSKQQNQRLRALAEKGLANWKLSPFDEKYLERWSESKKYRNLMFSWTDKNYSPWTVISSKKSKKIRLEAMRHLLSTLAYDGKQDAAVSISPNPVIVQRFHRSMIKED